MDIEIKGKTAEIKFSTDLIGTGSYEFVKKMNELIAEDMKRFNFDFADVSMIDSYALSNLIVFCDKPDLEFAFRNVNKAVKNIFDIIKLNKQVLIELPSS
jgi:anti-anti-sigma regulatory factor